MEFCRVGVLGEDAIAGMGRIGSATLTHDYATLTGLEPELQVDGPAWVIQFRGDVMQLRPVGEVWVDPICVVIDGSGGFYATGGYRTADGALRTPAPVDVPPRYSLPPLDP